MRIFSMGDLLQHVDAVRRFALNQRPPGLAVDRHTGLDVAWFSGSHLFAMNHHAVPGHRGDHGFLQGRQHITPKSPNFFFQMQYVASDTPIWRQTSTTGVPESVNRSAYAIVSSVNLDLFIASPCAPSGSSESTRTYSFEKSGIRRRRHGLILTPAPRKASTDRIQ